MRFRFLVILATLALSAVAFSSSALATTSDSCLDFGPGQNNCFAGTSENWVNFGTVQLGLYTAATFTLVCEKYDVVKFKQGRIAANGTRNFFVEQLFGWHNPNCVLTAHGYNTKSGKNARVRVTLVN